jgi:Rieske Fe-S protein
VRSRRVVMLAGLIVVVVAAGSAIAISANRRTHAPPTTFTVDVANLAAGQVQATGQTVRVGNLTHAPVFVARERDGEVLAFLGRSTHLGCRVVLTGDPNRAPLAKHAVFDDPCGGSEWALTGACVDGPCPRGLDRFGVEVAGGNATIDLSKVVRGSPATDTE